MQTHGVQITTRNRTNDSQFKHNTVLVDKGNEWLARKHKPFLAVPTDDTWYVVPPEESIIFLNDEGICKHLDSPLP